MFATYLSFSGYPIYHVCDFLALVFMVNLYKYFMIIHEIVTIYHVQDILGFIIYCICQNVPI